MSCIASLDIGTVRIGVAVSDADRKVALAYGTIHVGQCADPWAEIGRILAQEKITRVVVGWPLELDGSEGAAVRRTRQFLSRLRQQCPNLKIIPQDERLTSSAAEHALQEMETRGSRKKAHVDAMAACLILQMYLDRMQAARSREVAGGGAAC
ncbi:MAG: Holliday junction resolvase RuvX [Proteobacteria bacterium]|nr:Holliday junction resolvase RuvX [Pseudomonadota bacterium]